MSYLKFKKTQIIEWWKKNSWFILLTGWVILLFFGFTIHSFADLAGDICVFLSIAWAISYLLFTLLSSEVKDYRKWKKTQSVTQKESKGEN